MIITEVGRKIIELRKSRKSLKEIKGLLGCSKSTISKYINMVPENAEITTQNIDTSLVRRYDKGNIRRRQQREIAMLKMATPDRPSRFSSYKAALREAAKCFLMQPASG